MTRVPDFCKVCLHGCYLRLSFVSVSLLFWLSRVVLMFSLLFCCAFAVNSEFVCKYAIAAASALLFALRLFCYTCAFRQLLLPERRKSYIAKGVMNQ